MNDFLMSLLSFFLLMLFTTTLVIGVQYIGILIKKFRRRNSKYYYFQPNIKRSPGRSSGDCAIRATAKVFGITWEQAFVKLSEEAIKCGCITSTSWMLYEFFLERGFSLTKVKNKWYKRNMLFMDFVKEHPSGTFLVFSTSHVAVCKDGVLYDSWDSRDEEVYVYMEQEANDYSVKTYTVNYCDFDND